MTKVFVLFLALLLGISFAGCSSTEKSPEQAKLDALMAKYRDQQSDQVSDLESDYYWSKWENKLGNDFARHNWIEYPYAGAMWLLTFVSTGHQRRDFEHMHKGMDRHLFNASWDDPALSR